MSLKVYRNKRHFDVTPEPQGGAEEQPSAGKSLVFVVQKHQASHLHYDFRLEWDGVLLSWAVPKGPSMDASVKRLAMPTEDHPIEYADFEGVIPENQYGGGTVMVWDRGTWKPEVEMEDVPEALEKGDLKFTLLGTKLKGSWVLVRTGGRFAGSAKRLPWLLIKHRDNLASNGDVVIDEPRSATSGRLLAEIARDGGGDVEKATAGDPVARSKAANRSPGPPRRHARNRLQSK
jgi:bifunctional non-homologous end joining protein LigD